MELSEKDHTTFEAFLSRSNLSVKKHQLSGLAWALSKERDGNMFLCYRNKFGKSGKGADKASALETAAAQAEAGAAEAGAAEAGAAEDGLEKKIMVVRGGLLADEMGLGKTIQMIGAMVCNPLQKTLIVVPRALVEQWHRAIAHSTGHDALVYHGADRFKHSLEDIAARPIVITTYSLVAQKINKKKGRRQDRDQRQDQEPVVSEEDREKVLETKKDKKEIFASILHKFKWDRIIFDEAHHLRNDNTAVFSGAKALRSSVRWLVTGTPIQNRRKDFYSLCEQIGIPRSYYTDGENLLSLVRLFIMKRTKADAGIVLPDLHTTTERVEWEGKEEKDLAENFHALLNFSKVKKNYVDNIISNLNLSTLSLLVRARQSCVYPGLMKGKVLTPYAEHGILKEDKDISVGVQGTSKLNAVVSKILSRKENKNAKLVFCHFRGEIDFVKDKLTEGGMHVETFDGRVKAGDRERILGGECDVLILQIQTGCEGLNLQHFNEVYFVSPHWNPAVEDQAIARCHRIGQEKEVEVFRFMMDSFDDDDKTITLDKYSSDVQDVKRDIMTELDDKETEDEKKSVVKVDSEQKTNKA